MFVRVIAMLVVAVPIMQVVDMVAVDNGLVTVPLGVHALMIGVDHFLTVQFVPVDVVDMTFVFHGLVAVAGQVFVVRCGVSLVHGQTVMRIILDSNPGWWNLMQGTWGTGSLFP